MFIVYVDYLPRGFDSLPDTEVNHNPDGHQTQHELPVELSRFIQTRRDVQHLVPVQREEDVHIKPAEIRFHKLEENITFDLLITAETFSQAVSC